MVRGGEVEWPAEKEKCPRELLDAMSSPWGEEVIPTPMSS